MNPASLLNPPRIRAFEHLDDPQLDSALALRSLADIRCANRLFGGRRAVLAELRPVFAAAVAPTGAFATATRPRPLTLLDVGTGAGDIPAAARRLAAAMGVTLEITGLEWTAPLAGAARHLCATAVAGDARRLPFADRSIDIVTCSQLLHHFDDADALALIREMHRVARARVIVGEIRRSWFAAAGLWLASWPLGFHAVSRHDGVVSVLRGFRGAELADLIRRATGAAPSVANRLGFRVTASWSRA